jgi:predicted PurR-regulated permease PerM
MLLKTGFAMDTQIQPASEESYIAKAIELFVRLGLVFLLVVMCFEIIRPFALPVAWGIIIAIGAHPAYRKIRKLVGELDKVAAVVFTLLMLVVIMVPIGLLTESLVSGAHTLVLHLQGDTFVIPAPPQHVQEWPLIGKPIYTFWMLASQDLAAAARKVGPQIKTFAGAVMATAAGVGLGIVYFIAAVIIAGVLLAKTQALTKSSLAVAQRFVGARAQEFLNLVESTVRNVFRGILAVAAIQATMAGIGFLLAGVPAAGLWAFIALMLSVIQIGPALVVIPLIIYVFSTSNGLTATLFLIWNVLVLISDNFLKPLLMGRGAKVPVLVIFLGAIGGFISMGIIGLFVGSIILAVGYELSRAWIYQRSPGVEKPHTV